MSGIKVNVNFFRVDPYALCITHGLFRIPWYFEFGFFGRNYSSRRLTPKTQVKVQVICDQNNTLRHKPHEKLFRVDPGRKKIQKRENKYYFPGAAVLRNRSPIWEVWQLSTHLWYVRENCKTSQIWLHFLKTTAPGNISKQNHMCIWERPNWLEILAPSQDHLIFYLRQNRAFYCW